MIIYIIRNLKNRKMYIGLTKKTLKQRISEHFSTGKKCRALKEAIEKYDKSNFEYFTWDQCETREEGLKLEEFWIKHFNTLEPNGYNIKLGPRLPNYLNKIVGDKLRGREKGPLSHDHKNKIAKALIGKNTWTKGSKRNIDYSKEYLNNLSQRMVDHNPMKGKFGKLHHHFGKKKSEGHNDMLAIRHGAKEFKVVERDTDRIIWQGFNKAKCKRDTGLDRSTIIRHLKGKVMLKKKYVIKYVGE